MLRTQIATTGTRIGRIQTDFIFLKRKVHKLNRKRKNPRKSAISVSSAFLINVMRARNVSNRVKILYHTTPAVVFYQRPIYLPVFQTHWF